MNNFTSLIAGSTGFLGSKILNALNQEDNKIYCLSRRDNNHSSDNIEQIIVNFDSLEELKLPKVDHVFLCLGYELRAWELLSMPEKLKKPLKIWQDSRFNDSDWNKMHQALLGVIESDYGTARSIRDLKELEVAGKSGTAELVSLDSKEAYQEVRTSELLRDHSIIIVFGPMPNPKYAVSVVIENGESGGAVAGPVAIEVLKSLINE